MELSLKKHRDHMLKWLIPFILVGAADAVLALSGVLDSGVTVLIIALLDAMFLLLPASYHMLLFFAFRSKRKGCKQYRGEITGWETGLLPIHCCVYIRIGDREFATVTHFSRREAQSMVGRQAIYTVIDDMLYLYALVGE